jgi:hypothetical protein
VVELPGLRPFYPELEGENACVDATIAPIIRTLNDLGFRTWVSCSGLPEDHPSKPFEYGPFHAYIGFSWVAPRALAVALTKSGFRLDPNKAAYMSAHGLDLVDNLGRPLTPEQCRDNWKALAAELDLLRTARP